MFDIFVIDGVWFRVLHMLFGFLTFKSLADMHYAFKKEGFHESEPVLYKRMIIVGWTQYFALLLLWFLVFTT